MKNVNEAASQTETGRTNTDKDKDTNGIESSFAVVLVLYNTVQCNTIPCFGPPLHTPNSNMKQPWKPYTVDGIMIASCPPRAQIVQYSNIKSSFRQILGKLEQHCSWRLRPTAAPGPDAIPLLGEHLRLCQDSVKRRIS